jgi:6-phosphogluconolactonase
MSFRVEIFPTTNFAEQAAARIALALPGAGGVVLTGGTTAAQIYPQLVETDRGWGDVEVLFSDERCVPPDSPDSNFGMVKRLLLDHVKPGRVHRMRGEDPSDEAAVAYHESAREAMEKGLDLVLLGMGADCHVAGMFPGSDALDESHKLCVAVERPDGMPGLTLTSPVLTRSGRILLLVAGEKKAEALRRALDGDERPVDCPARMLADHPDTTFLVDEPAASLL